MLLLDSDPAPSSSIFCNKLKIFDSLSNMSRGRGRVSAEDLCDISDENISCVDLDVKSHGPSN